MLYQHVIETITTRPNGSREFKIIDHLGGTRMVLSDNATRINPILVNYNASLF
ncbi:MAG: hypothetical protein JNL32_01825 [Candidatus Kapabacteria bacterium]|nr:hypothetical protein [Candidatus Kapabacteria bacterium]